MCLTSVQLKLVEVFQEITLWHRFSLDFPWSTHCYLGLATKWTVTTESKTSFVFRLRVYGSLHIVIYFIKGQSKSPYSISYLIMCYAIKYKVFF